MIFDRSAPLVEELRVQLAAERKRTEDLMATIVEMRREGFQMPDRMDPLSEEPLGLPQEVMDAVDTRGITRQARERLMQEARRMLRDSEPELVAERILEGEQSFSWGT